jgi:stress responsive alpha/beta barrel protein
MRYFLAILILTCGLALKTSAADGKLYHVVSFKFKETATKEQIKGVEDAFRDLKKKIKEIQSYEWGTNVSPEKHDKGFTHAFILTFKSDKDRDAYLVHPDHKAFGKLVGPVLADVFVVDFWATK